MTNPIHFTTAEEAVKVIKSGDHVHLSSVASAPQCLINAMCKRGEAGELKDVHVHHLHTEGPAPYADPKFEGVFQLDSFFVGSNVRKVTQSGYADYIPIFLSETQRLYRCGAVPCNVAMIQVCPPDKHGYVSLGTSVDATLAAVECADYVIAVVNKHVPRSFGQAMIPMSKIDLFVEDDTPLMEAHFSEPNEVETAIGKHCAALIEDGATLQMGIGAIPNAVLAQLGGHKNLGIHTEMFADGVLPLVEKGVINGMTADTFAPDAGLTRAQFCAIVVRALGLSQEKTAEFTDVLQSDWFCGFVGAASKAGIVNGVGNGKFNPQGAITREQAATMLARASKTLGLSGEAKDADAALKMYPDAQAASSYAKDALAFCAEHNILESDRTKLRPGEAICRCEVAQMVWNLLAAAGEV